MKAVRTWGGDDAARARVGEELAILAERRDAPDWGAMRPPLVPLDDARRRAAGAAFDGAAVA